MIKFYEYKKCTTCRKAKKYLQDNGITIEEIEMVEEPPSKYELKDIISKARNYSIDDFFNTRGKLYKTLGLKEKVGLLSTEEKLVLLTENGMLIKRPMIVTSHDVELGFSEQKYNSLLDLE